jgi:hypothetical protein
MSTWRTGAALAIVATAALMGSGPVASASAGPLTATATLTMSMACDGGGGGFSCDLTIGGGTAPYTTRWSGLRVTFSSTSTYSAYGTCQAKSVSVTATVRDSAGHQVSSTKSIYCAL